MTDGDEAALDALEAKLAGTEAMVGRFSASISALDGQVRQTDAKVKGLSQSFGTSLKSAIDGVTFDGLKLSDALKSLASSMLNATYNAATKPVTDALGGAVAGGLSSVMPFQNGGSFSQGRVMPFARGGIVEQATTFPMRNGTGLMGEAGPEAIMPLTRGPDGRLGVATHGGRAAPVSVNMNVSTPDVQGFRKSKTQLAAEMSRALSRGSRNR